jgi:hypothetical protein
VAIRTLLTFAKVAFEDGLGRRARIGSTAEHRDAAIRWLERAHEASRDGGVSYGYSIRGGWRPAYIETSGYIIVTLLDLFRRGHGERLNQRARSIADWLCTVQNQDGSFSNPRFSQGSGIVFDTGQVLFGLVRAAQEFGDPRALHAARRAAEWLVSIADSEGRWTRNTYRGIPHVYNTRVAWALLEFDRLEHRAQQEETARANLDWALSQARGGFFDQCAFELGAPPFTHTIAYAIRGLQESGRLLDDRRYAQAATRSAAAVRGLLRNDGFLPGKIAVSGASAATYCCLTGNCQMAVIWSEEARRGGCRASQSAATAALRYVMRSQDIDSSNADLCGGIKGSQPVWGGYAPFSYPNWATKFFIDAMLRCEAWL